MNDLTRMSIEGMNLILYCTHFTECVQFYSEMLGFPIVSNHEWFIEFKIAEGTYLSCMDENHTSIKSSGGAGTTLTFKVDDAETVHTMLKDKGAEPSDLKVRHWAVKSFFLHDPDGYRLEIWSQYYKRPQSKQTEEEPS